MLPTAKFLLTMKSPGAQSFAAYGENILTVTIDGAVTKVPHIKSSRAIPLLT
jgi:hypothetical protein